MVKCFGGIKVLDRQDSYRTQTKILTSKVFYKESVNKINLTKILGEDKKNILLIYDKNLLKLPAFQLLKKQVKFTYPVSGGEGLKELSEFVLHFTALNKKYAGIINRQTHIVSVGGGSVGDFIGFLSSVWKRGLQLTHVPSTWLSAVDSAHGGKTALNLGMGKNQLGSFHFASKIIIIKDLIKSSSLEAAYGEILKIAFLKRALLKAVKDSSHWSVDFFWDLLPKLVRGKYFYLSKDPFEEKGKRVYLNLGHTLAHVLELHSLIPHGGAVILGLDFSLNWSLKKKFISSDEHSEHSQLLVPLVDHLRPKVKLMSDKKFIKLLLQDKKMQSNQQIQFIFFKSKGHKVVKVRLDSLVAQLQWAGYIK